MPHVIKHYLLKREYTLEDFRSDITNMSRPSFFDHIFHCVRFLFSLPPVNQPDPALRCEIDRDLRRSVAVIDSMTPTERSTPQIIDQPRRQRIARGAGVRSREVKQFLASFQQLKLMVEKPYSEWPKTGRTGKRVERRPGDEPPDQNGGAVCS